jgi:hypothetical protein
MAQLIIPSEATSQTYVVGAPQTAFPFSFAVFAKSDLHFAVNGVELLQTDFTLAGTLLSGGGYQGGTVNLNFPVSAVTCVLFRETATARTSNFSPAPTVPVRDIDTALNRLTAQIQDVKRDQPTGGLVVSGVASVAGRTGTVSLTAADVATGFGTAVGASLIAGSNITLSTVGGFTTVSSAGGGAVSSVAGRTGSVTLAVADVSGFGTGVAAALAAGTNVTLSTLAGVTTINASVTSAVSSVAGRTGSVTLTASDVSSGFGTAVGGALTAGANISLSTAGGVTTITGTGAGGVPNSYAGAYENNIRAANSAATNATNLNSLIASLSAAGGGEINFNEPGPIPLGSTITLKSNVNFNMGGSHFVWSGSGTGNIFQSLTTDVLTGLDTEIFIDEGSSFSGKVIMLHSNQHNRIRARGLGSNTGSTFFEVTADSSSGAFSGGNLNTAFCHYEISHRGLCGNFILVYGLAGGSQVVTDLTFYNCQANNVNGVGFRIEYWADTITFAGFNYAQISGSGGVGFIVNQAASGTPSVYNIHIESLAIDTFSTGLGRYGMVLSYSKGIYCGAYYQGPVAENGDFIGTNCTSYQIRKLITSTASSGYNAGTSPIDSIYIHQKAVATGL